MRRLFVRTVIFIILKNFKQIFQIFSIIFHQPDIFEPKPFHHFVDLNKLILNNTHIFYQGFTSVLQLAQNQKQNLDK